MKVAIERSQPRVDRLREEATRLGVTPEELARAAVADLLSAQREDFRTAAVRATVGVAQESRPTRILISMPPNGSRLSCGRARTTTDRRADAREPPDRPPAG